MVEFIGLMDPEIVIPAPENAGNDEFWLRFLERSQLSVAKMGPATYERFIETCDNVSTAPVGLRSDIWRLVSLYASRVLTLKNISEDNVCVEHLLENYAATFGASENATTLVSDLKYMSGDQLVIIETGSEWFQGLEQTRETCSKCLSMNVTATSSTLSAEKFEKLQTTTLRQYFLISASKPSDMARYAEKMFPNLLFSSEAWSSLGSLKGAKEEVYRDLFRDLSILDENVIKIWSEYSGTAERIARVKALGALCSPDSPGTHKNKSAQKSRVFRFKREDGEEDLFLSCEWHLKLKPHINRIYFKVEKSKVYIGTIIDHLPN